MRDPSRKSSANFTRADDMAAIDDLNDIWRKSFANYEAAWRQELNDVREEAFEKISKLEKDKKKSEEAMKKAQEEYDRKVKDLRKAYNASIDKLTAELKKQYEEDRRKMMDSIHETEKLSEEFEKEIKELQEFREEVEQETGNIIEQFRKATEELSRTVISRSENLLKTIDEAGEDDPDLEAHSMNMSHRLRRNVENVLHRATDDDYYYYAEFILMNADLSDLSQDVAVCLENAATVRKEEQRMAEVKKAILGFIGDNQYMLVRDHQNRPWEPYYVEFYDLTGTVYRLYASYMGFTVEVLCDSDDGEVAREYQGIIESQIGGLYHTKTMKQVTGYSARTDYELAAARLAASERYKPLPNTGADRYVRN